MDAPTPDPFAEKRLTALLDTLRLRGHRLTPQRAAILSALVRHTGHPTVDELHRLIQPDFPTTSLATVYKTIALLKDHGEVLELGVAESSSRYDGRRPRPHPHLVCTRCSQVLDPDETSEAALHQLVEVLAQQSGYRVETFRLELYGLCPACRRG